MTLSYADSLARDRVSIDRGEGYLRVISPPAGSWRKLPRGYRVAIVILGLFLGLCFWGAITGRTPLDRRAAAFDAALFSVILVIVIGVAYERLRRSFVFELTGRTLSMTRLTPWGPMSTRTWPRPSIGAVRILPGSGRLMIRVTGQDMVELWLGPDQVANGVVADALSAGLAEAPLSASGASRPGAPASHLYMPRPLPPGAGRTAMLVTAATFTVVAIAVAVFLSVELALVFMLFAAIPAGIALGTQKKDVYP